MKFMILFLQIMTIPVTVSCSTDHGHISTTRHVGTPASDVSSTINTKDIQTKTTSVVWPQSETVTSFQSVTEELSRHNGNVHYKSTYLRESSSLTNTVISPQDATYQSMPDILLTFGPTETIVPSFTVSYEHVEKTYGFVEKTHAFVEKTHAFAENDATYTRNEIYAKVIESEYSSKKKANEEEKSTMEASHDKEKLEATVSSEINMKQSSYEMSLEYLVKTSSIDNTLSVVSIDMILSSATYNTKHVASNDKEPSGRLLTPTDVLNKNTPNLASSVGNELLGKCFQSLTCKNNINAKRPSCYCDAFCKIYKDCCLDVETSTADKNTEAYVHGERLAQSSTCVRGKNVKNGGYVMVTKCPVRSWLNVSEKDSIQMNRLAIKCENLNFRNVASFIPVQDEYGFVFRNKYCAHCHRVAYKQQWNLKEVHCQGLIRRKEFLGDYYLSEVLVKGFLSTNTRCEVLPVPPDQTSRPRFCYDTLKPRKCKQNITFSLEVRDACTSLHAPVQMEHDMFEVYNNPYCVYCENGIIAAKRVKCMDNTEQQTPLFTAFSLSSLIAIKDEMDERDGCQPGQMYQSFIGKCIDVSCPLYHTVYRETCAVNTVTFTKPNIGFQLHYCFQIIGVYTEAMVIYTLHELFELVPMVNHLFELRNFYLRHSCDDAEKHYLCSDFNYRGPTSFVCTELELLDIFQLFSRQFTLNFLNESSVLVAQFILTSTSTNSNCSDAQVVYWKERNIHATCSDSSNSTYLYNSEMFKRHIEFSKVCTIVSHLTKENIGYDADTISKIIEISITYACMGLSVSLISASILSKGRAVFQESIPQKIVLHSMFMLALSYVLFMTTVGANDIDLLCQVFGMLLHYTWVCNFAWSSICSFHLYYVFVVTMKNPRLMINIKSDRMYKKYCFIGYLLPFLTVLPVVVIHIMKVNDVSRYGMDVCFLTDREALIFGFIVPMVTSLLFNSLLYIITVISYTRLHFEVKTCVLRKGYFDLFLTCLKMSLFNCVGWIFGLMGNAWDNVVLRIAFIVLTSLHGALLSLVFGSHRKYKCCKKSDVQSGASHETG